MMNLYRYRHTASSANALPTIPGISFTETFRFTRESDISLDRAEDIWNRHNCLLFELYYTQTSNIFYVLLSDSIEVSLLDYKHFILDNFYTDITHTYDYSVLRVIPLFLEQFQKRIRTRQYLNDVQRSIPFPPTELAYHQQFVEKVNIYSYMDEYELPLIRACLYESQDIVKDEKEYRPDGVKVSELKEDFEELSLLTKSL